MRSRNHTPQYLPRRNEHRLPQKRAYTWMCTAPLSPGQGIFHNPEAITFWKDKPRCIHMAQYYLGMEMEWISSTSSQTDTGRQSSLSVCVSYSCCNKLPWTWHRTQPFYSLAVLQARSPRLILRGCAFSGSSRGEPAFWPLPVSMATWSPWYDAHCPSPRASLGSLPLSLHTAFFSVVKAPSAASSLHYWKYIRSHPGKAGCSLHLRILCWIMQKKSWLPHKVASRVDGHLWGTLFSWLHKAKMPDKKSTSFMFGLIEPSGKGDTFPL